MEKRGNGSDECPCCEMLNLDLIIKERVSEEFEQLKKWIKNEQKKLKAKQPKRL